MAQKKEFSPTHPFIVFWLGVLTGIIGLALISYYSTMSMTPEEYQSSTLRYFNPYSYSAPTYSIGDPTTSIGDPTTSIGDPTTSFGDPQF